MEWSRVPTQRWMLYGLHQSQSVTVSHSQSQRVLPVHRVMFYRWLVHMCGTSRRIMHIALSRRLRLKAPTLRVILLRIIAQDLKVPRSDRVNRLSRAAAAGNIPTTAVVLNAGGFGRVVVLNDDEVDVVLETMHQDLSGAAAELARRGALTAALRAQQQAAGHLR
jgi:hypothetical protein